MNYERYLIGQIFWKPSLINKLAITPDDLAGDDNGYDFP